MIDKREAMGTSDFDVHMGDKREVKGTIILMSDIDVKMGADDTGYD